MVISAGIDMGTQRVKVAILKDKQIIAQSQQFSGFEPTKAAEQAFQEALQNAKLSRTDIQHVKKPEPRTKYIEHSHQEGQKNQMPAYHENFPGNCMWPESSAIVNRRQKPNDNKHDRYYQQRQAKTDKLTSVPANQLLT